MRLIDAETLYDIIQNCTGFYDNQDIDVVLDVIDSRPTAYDVENVIKEFEAKQIFCDKFEDISIFEALDIVKRGGIDDI